MNNTANPFNEKMNLAIILFIFSFCSLCTNDTISQNITYTFTQVSDGLCFPSGPGCYEIKINNLPPNNNPANVPQGYLSFWDFGDGTYTTKQSTPGAAFDTVYHRFRLDPFASGQEAFVQLTKRYSDNDKPKKLVIPPGNSISNTTAYPLSNLNNLGAGVKIVPSLSPRSLDTSIYVVSCQVPSFCGPSDFHLNFTYLHDPRGSNEISIDPATFRFYNKDGNVVNNISPDIDNQKGFVSMPVSGTVGFQTVNVMFGLQFSRIPEGEDVKLIAELIDSSGSCDIEQFHDTITIKSVRSHDPNLITANKPSICSNYTGEIEYSIIFQNIGTGPARVVHVKTTIPEYFLFGSNHIQTIEPDGLVFKTNNNDRELEWILTTPNGYLKKGYAPNILRGTEEYGFGIGTPKEEYTIDTVTFKVQIDPSKTLPSCGLIPMRAKIFFDNNSPIATNDFLTRIKCNGCDPCTETVEEFTSKQIILNTNRPIKIFKTDKNATQNKISPNAEIIEETNDYLRVLFKEPGNYTFVSSSNCSRTISTIPVHKGPDKPIIEESCNWWTCLLTINKNLGTDSVDYIWEYKKNGEWEYAFGNSLNFTGKDSVNLAIRSNIGSFFTYSPCVPCWKNFCLRYWWAILAVVFLIVIFVYLFKQHKKRLT